MSWQGEGNVLVEKAKALRLGHVEALQLGFASLTTFNRTSARSKGFGGIYQFFTHFLNPLFKACQPAWAYVHFLQKGVHALYKKYLSL
jgi:hypothetical protein